MSTIKPIQLIVTAIAGDHVESLQLIPDFASPHNYSFKPRDIKKIQNATLVFRIDEHFESFLNAALALNTQEKQLISLAEEEGITLLSLEGDSHQHGHSDDHNESETDEHEKHNDDLHIWTSPKNALVIAKAISANLAKVDPQNASHYRKNLQQFTLDISLANKKIGKKLSSVKNKHYVVFHNSWRYFAHFFGLESPEVISLHEDLSDSMKSILDTRKKIKTMNITCVLSDPNTKLSRVNVLIEDLPVKTASIDVLATKIKKSKNGYINWLEKMGNDIEHCLSD